MERRPSSEGNATAPDATPTAIPAATPTAGPSTRRHVICSPQQLVARVTCQQEDLYIGACRLQLVSCRAAGERRPT